jgi:arsenate reductase (glutaredoxin)
MTNVTIYHNPACGTSRNTLQYLRDQAIEPTVIEYLKTPPDRATLKSLLQRMNMKPGALIRRRGDLYASLGLDNPALTDDQLLDAMLEHPIVMERPIVVTPKGVRLCRPWETVKELIPG